MDRSVANWRLNSIASAEICSPNKVPFWAVGLGVGASELDRPSAFRPPKKPCPRSVRKRCTGGFPQGSVAELLHGASNNVSMRK